MKKLSTEDFRRIIKNTPLVSIDLVIENPEGKILLGLRNNLPAEGYWFVPGGRIFKDEKFKDAFRRIVKDETGMNKNLEDSNFLGIYEHIYPGENYFGDPEFGTHYFVIAYRIKLEGPVPEYNSKQHTRYWWASPNELQHHPKVHENTKNYFNGLPSFSE
ncbi:MAG: GDP-mannose mannosyl hydrolase [Bacteroidales bacterium]|jgi:colanic acid biosynthesis protein WcaH